DKSLVLAEDARGEARYRFLETIRQYAEGKLLDAGEAAAARDRHRDWYVGFAERAEAQDRTWYLNRVDAEYDNLRAALGWCRADARGSAAGLRLAGSLGWFWASRGHLAESAYWQDAFLSVATEPSAARAKALLAASHALRFEGDAVRARSL